MYQASQGADYIMLFDSWGGQLSPQAWDNWSAPYIRTIISRLRAVHPHVPTCLYANGSAGLLERMAACGADVIGLDWSVDMADARARLGSAQAVQVKKRRRGSWAGRRRRRGLRVAGLR